MTGMGPLKTISTTAFAPVQVFLTSVAAHGVKNIMSPGVQNTDAHYATRRSLLTSKASHAVSLPLLDALVPSIAKLHRCDKVFRRYVSSASVWHSRLVRFFQAQTTSPRRCEELPWHLNKCYRWHPLKNTLVDLRTFEVRLPSYVVAVAAFGQSRLPRPSVLACCYWHIPHVPVAECRV